jgi:hypothetical protein
MKVSLRNVAAGLSAVAMAVAATIAVPTAAQAAGTQKNAPYLFLGWGNPPTPSTVMNATGIRWFTMAFILSNGGCAPAWDGFRPLQGGVDAQAIANIRSAGGNVIPSIGGWSGNKLGPRCSSPQALANAYMQVINAYNLSAIDVDIENTDEFENATVQDRILGALKIVKQQRPSVRTIITFGTTTSGPNTWGQRLITRAAQLQANIDVFTIMPFDFGSSNIAADTKRAADNLRDRLKAAFGWSDSTAYSRMGISGMNGLSDQREMTSLAAWTDIRNWAAARHLARFTFWAVNRDRPCPGGGVQSTCSGISQQNWEFTRITAGYNG